jgi:hypothetical protein
VLAGLAAASTRALAAPPYTRPEDTGRRAEAVQHFEKGIALYDQGAWAAALAEFLEARRIYPLRNAVYQAGLCLERLQRYDEGLEQFEAALRDFGDTMPAQIKEAVQGKVVAMRGLVGEIAVEGAELGATITVDGVGRGEHPLLAPLRVAAGSHLVRVSKTGFLPFEARVVIAGGRTERLAARLAPLGPSGRLRIAEQHGRALDLLVDGVRVGAAPWEGPLGPGPHTVSLRGDNGLGTPPVPVTVQVDRTTPLTLLAEELGAVLRVEPEPVNASVAIDGVSVGRGVWEGRLHARAHRVEVGGDGFLSWAREVHLARDERRSLRVALARDPRSSFARRPPRFTLEVTVAATVAPLFGADVASACGDACKGTLGLGGLAFVHGGYELRFGLGFGLAAGYLGATQRLTGRTATFTPVGLPSERIAVDDMIWIHAGLVGAWAGFSLGVPVPIHLRLGAGALLGSAADTRSRVATIVPSGELQRLEGVYVAPEIRVGLALSRRIEVSVGLALLLAFVPSPPRWSAAHEVILESPSVRPAYGTFPAESYAGPIVAFTPGIGARYVF